ncbi:hypothetical protein HWV62_33998 [Athelia sp. TMB]|nr:hypothetical protein HWV62_33998 [Athelia sp. TMB]
MDVLAHTPLSTDPAAADHTANPENEEWDEEDENYEEDDEDYIDAEAEEIAQRLRDQLWADINAARASAGIPPAVPAASTAPPTAASPEVAVAVRPLSKKEEAAIATMEAIVAFAEKDATVRAILEFAILPDSHGDNVFSIISRSAASRTVPKSIAKSLSNLLVSLARSDTLFSTLRHSNAGVVPSDKGKRKRDDEEDTSQKDNSSTKRPFVAPSDLQTQIEDAVRAVTQALSALGSTSRPLEHALVASVQQQLHQIFLFAVTSSAGGGTNANALQEISGLIQVIGVLSGIQIGPTADTPAEQSPNPPESTAQSSNTNSHSLQVGDIGTAVYPCPTCDKSFSRLYSLRAHQRIHSAERPYVCTSCDAAFARLYDLRRHAGVHETASWVCTGCDKPFSRSDAVKRHQDSARGRADGTGDACAHGEIREAHAGDTGADTRDGDHGDPIGDPGSGLADREAAEEGEIQHDVIARVQDAVLSLQGLLSTQVAATLGAPPGSEATPSADPSVGQATLASVIARAQQQNIPVRPIETGAEARPAGSDAPMDVGSAPLRDQRLSQEPEGSAPSLASYGLSSDQALLLEQAIANAAAAAQAQAEAEAALEEGEEDGEYELEDEVGMDVDGEVS